VSSAIFLQYRMACSGKFGRLRNLLGEGGCPSIESLSVSKIIHYFAALICGGGYPELFGNSRRM
jgi:hypothetical protein